VDLKRNSVRLAIVLLVALAACGSDDEGSLPAACLDPAGPLREALIEAPGRVELGGLPISGCLVKGSEAADIQRVGGDYVAVAAELGAAAAGDREGEEALRLGYLVGAVRRGSERTQGIHSELVRRLEQEAGTLPGSSRAYARGERAGRRAG
jgi:hypothetical protein